MHSREIVEIAARLSDMVSDGSLYLSRFTHFSLNIFIQLYRYNGSTTSMIEIVLFDVCDETMERLEIKDPEDLHKVALVEISEGEAGAYIHLCLSIANVAPIEFECRFADLAYYVVDRQVFR